MAELQVRSSPQVRVVVATTIMLSFISFWRAAAIVLNDLGSSAFYVGGIAEEAVGKAAAWFILAIMFFAYSVRAVYIESCTMFVRGGTYRVVGAAMGGTLAKLAVSALMFDYVLTGPISGVSAGHYLAGLINESAAQFGWPLRLPENATAVSVALLITIYFWWQNIKGIHESSDRALKIMYVTTAMVVVLILWCTFTIFKQGGQWPPAPVPSNLRFKEESLGWLHGFQLTGLVAILIAFGHSILAMSGEESLAQVNREIEHPKLKNLQKAGFVIFLFSVMFTGLVLFFAVALIPDNVRPSFHSNLISGLAMHVWGPVSLKLIFHAFVVLVGVLMLGGAVNTAIVGSNGVLNRVCEDGVLTDWFRKPHRRFGTSYRIINLVVALQILIILGSRGEVYILGEAYAFGVVWSFSFNALSMLLLRFRPEYKREWKVPLNPKIMGREIPLGLGVITAVLFATATINLLTKQVATIAGILFTGLFFVIFTISERITARERARRQGMTDQFQLHEKNVIDATALECRPGGILVTVRDYHSLGQLEWVLKRANPELRDVVVMTARILRWRGPSAGREELAPADVFSEYEQLLFTHVVAMAEKEGKPVKLMVVPTTDIYQAISQTAEILQAAEVVAGASAKMSSDEQARRAGAVWETLPGRRRRQLTFRIVTGPSQMRTYYLGAHAPNLTQEDINLIHEVWLEITDGGHPEVHHRDVVRVAVEQLREEMRTKGRDSVFGRFVH